MCLDHVLTVEGNSWLKCDELANTIDTYFANHSYDGRPKLASNSFRNKQVSSQSSGNQTHKPLNMTGITPSANITSSSMTYMNQRQDGLTGSKPGSQSQQQVKSVLCFICQSPNHKQASCPSKVNTPGKPGMGRGMARNYACAIETCMDTSVHAESRGPKNQFDRSPSDGHAALQACSVNVRPISSDGRKTNGEAQVTHERVTNTNVKDRADTPGRAGAPARVDNIMSAPPATGRQTTPASNTTGNVTRDAVLTSARAAVSTDGLKPTNPMVVEGLSKLNYVDINIHGMQGIHAALHDNGSEINLINRDFVGQLPHLPTMGRIKIKGVVGPAVETDLTLLDVSPIASQSDCINIAPPLREVFAICDELNENIILTADTVQRLAALRNYESSRNNCSRRSKCNFR